LIERWADSARDGNRHSGECSRGRTGYESNSEVARKIQCR
jgi:hypothetical protein